MKRNSVLCILVALLVSGCIIGQATDIVGSIKTIAEYGTYFGLKKASIDEEKAKYIEEGLRVAIQVLNTETVDGFFDVDAAMDKVPSSIKPYIAEAVSVVSGKYADVHGKIPADKVKYIDAILVGAFSGVENYPSLIRGRFKHKIRTEQRYALNRPQ